MNGVGWSDPWFRTGYMGIFAAIIMMFLVIPLYFTSFYAHVALQLAFVVLLFSLIVALHSRPLVFTAGLSLAFAFLAIDLWSLFFQSFFAMEIAFLFYCIFLVIAIIALADMVFKSTVIDTNLIFGAITVYLLAGIFWSKLYFLVETVFPGSFKGIGTIDVWDGDLGSLYRNQFDMTYYSFTTISTLGMGDITPQHHITKSLTALEAMFGQLYVATVVAKLVSTWRRNQIGKEINKSFNNPS